MRKPENLILIIGALLLLVIMPLMNAYGTAGSPMHVSDYTINLWGKYLSYAVLAISVNLLWGYTGLLSLGQCLFFSLGGYALGMHLMLKIGKLGQFYKAGNNPLELPDFMVFMGKTELPVHWIPFHNFWFAALMVFVVPGTVAFLFGWLAFRSRIKGVYFSILTQALTYAASLLFFQNKFTFGGNNGLTDFKTLLGADLNAADVRRNLYIATVILLFAVLLLVKWLLGTKFGKVQKAIRDSENRVLFSGYATTTFKLFIFVLCAVIAGAAGALYVPQVGIINPSEMTPDKSLEAVVWVAVGGRGTLLGPVYGAIFVNALKSWATTAYPDYWLIILGGLFVLAVLFAPNGIAGLPQQTKDIIAWFKRRTANRNAETAAVTPA
ncbi:MAG: urea ABC transporter permease subunit UrtC [Verrucomicrobiaceae bacterium]|nr:MAG: urea ABC transporter permease subunit UrtC [Verrucomicrobiaceae bacterium]